MIGLLEDSVAKDLLGGNDWQLLRLKKLYEAYGNRYDFCRFSLQKESGSLLCRLGEEGILYLSPSADRKELACHLEMTGLRKLSGNETAVDLQLYWKNTVITQGKIFALTAESIPETADNPLEVTCFQELKAVYAILCRTFGLPEDGFDSWYCDLSHKIRHQTLRCLLWPDTACAILLEEENRCFLSQLAVLPEKQGQGIGQSILRWIFARNAGKQIGLYSKNAETDRFYKKIGFKETGGWCQISKKRGKTDGKEIKIR